MRHDPTPINDGGASALPGSPAGRPLPGTAAELHRALAELARATVAGRRQLTLLHQARASLRPEDLRRRDESTPKRVEAKAAVTTYVTRLRESGLPPQQMLVVLKAAVRDAAPGVLDTLEARALTDDVVRWSIEAYYAP